MVQSRLRPLAWLATLGAFGASATLVIACSGKVSNGKLSTTSQPVSIGAISGTPGECPSGSAHPNACCDTSAGQAASCFTYPNAPFTQCANGATTYPDPRTCCPLDGNGACASPPPPPPDDGGSGSGGGSCVYPCPVGWYVAPGPVPVTNGGGTGGGSSGAGSSSSSSGGDSNGGSPGDGVTCCQTNPDGSGECMGSGSSGGGGCTCACPSCDPDAGECPPCPPCDCPPTPPSTPSCGQCPPGWQVPQGDPLLCCETAPDGTISCFSQGVPPPPPGEPSDAGVSTPPSSCFGGGGGGDDGSTFTQCGCSETVNGTDYTVTCTDPGATCSCSTGGANGTTSGPVPEPSTQCNDLAALFAACNFPH